MTSDLTVSETCQVFNRSNTKLNTKRLILIAALVIFGSLTLGACSGRAPSTSWHGVAVDAERAYISNGPFVYGVDLKNGDQIWQYPAESDSSLTFYAAPVLTEDGQLLVGSAGTSHPLVSLDPKTGKEKWAENFTGSKAAWEASPLVFNDKIYAPNTDGFLYILDMQGKPVADPLELGGALWSAPVTDGTLLYVTSLDHHLHIINPATNNSNSVGLGGAATSSPAVGNGGVYVGSFDSTIQFVMPDGGMKTFATTENWVWGSPVLDGETLYYTDLNGSVVSLNTADGKQNWSITQKNDAKESDAVVASPLALGDRIYIATESGNLVALDKSGKNIWDKPRNVGGKLYTAPIAAGDLILVAPFQAESGFALIAYDADGRQVWTFMPEQ